MSEYRVLTSSELIKKTQRMRNLLVDKITKDGLEIPEDPDTVKLLLEVMKDADRTALSELKINTDDQNAQQDRLAAMAIASLGSKMGSVNPFEVVVSTQDSYDSRVTADLKQLPNISPVPGNLDIGIANETYDSFIAKMEPEGVPVNKDSDSE